MSFADKSRDYRDWMVDLALKISKEITVNYDKSDYPVEGPDGMKSPGEEYKVAEILKKEAEKLGIKTEVHACDEKRPNLICRVGQAKPGYKKLCVLLHMDTVPSGGEELWDFKPFECFTKDGKLYGRGVLDNKGPLASSFAALRMLKEIEDQIEGEFIFGAVPDEEVGIYHVGLSWLLEQKLLDCTDAIIPDIAGNMKLIDIAEKGRIGLKIKAHGKQAHAMNPEKGVNAIDGMAELIGLIEKYEFKFEPHPLLEKPTRNLGLIKGGSAPNNVAAECEVVYDMRIVPGMTKEGVIKEVEALAARINRPGLRFEVGVSAKGYIPPTEISEDAPIVKLIQKHVSDAKTFGMGGGTFCHDLILEGGIDAVGFAPGSDDTYHMANEEIEIDELTDFSRVLSEIALELCNQKS